jgi:DNA-binding response OmpR family regulator
MDRSFLVRGVSVDLTNNEFNLLTYLLRNKNKVVSQDDIAKDVWDIAFDTETNYINVYISYLRKKIRAITESNYIETIRKKGFVIRCS